MIDLSINLFSDFQKLAKQIHKGDVKFLEGIEISKDEMFNLTVCITHSLDDTVNGGKPSSLLHHYTLSAYEYEIKTKKPLSIKIFLKVWGIFSKESREFMNEINKDKSKGISYLN